MAKNDNWVSRSRALATKVVFAALKSLKENNKELPQRQVFLEVEHKVQLDEWAAARYEKTGNVRWQSVLHFYSIDCVKAGYLIKKSGIWYLTPEGEEAVKLGEMGLFTAANAAYKQWKLKKQSLADIPESDETDVEVTTQNEGLTVEQAEAMALEGIKQFINAKNPYEFQDLAAALLRGMSYYTPFIAPRGKDGGVDIIAYRNPLGTVSPRIKLQIKHRRIAATV